MGKILILTSGPVSKLDGFESLRGNSKTDFDLGSFGDISYHSKSATVLFKDKDLREYSLIYFRLVGKSLETASVVASYAKENGIKLIDEIYENPNVLVSTVSKYLEYYRLAKAVPIPETFFASIQTIGLRAPKIFKYPFIVKSTTGRKARDVWFIEKENLEETFKSLRKREVRGDRFFAQAYIPTATRIRVLVIGDEVAGGVERPSKYLSRVIENVTDDAKEALKIGYSVVPNEYKSLAIKATKAVGLNISGVDILKDKNTDKLYVIEANAAPAWRLINKYCGIIVEERILKYLEKLVQP